MEGRVIAKTKAEARQRHTEADPPPAAKDDNYKAKAKYRGSSLRSE
jgi:hypothetical protein